MFCTVPTALGKPGKLRSSFPQFPQPLLLDIVMKKKTEKRFSKADPIRVDKMLLKA
ncbi:MAG TPA: hypothetical protein VJ023_10110 [Pyrinomonadaceae bacterium]|nr:hypothetical protein [Pyrinomonadaceae bacterium]